MAMSGITIDPVVQETYKLMKEKKNKLRCMFLNIYKNDSGKEQVSMSRETPDDENITTLEELAQTVKDRYANKACYAVFDYHHQGKEDLVLVKFVDDNGPIKEKMLYGSTFTYLKGKLEGFKKAFELSDPDDITTDIAKAF